MRRLTFALPAIGSGFNPAVTASTALLILISYPQFALPFFDSPTVIHLLLITTNPFCLSDARLFPIHRLLLVILKHRRSCSVLHQCRQYWRKNLALNPMNGIEQTVLMWFYFIISRAKQAAGFGFNVACDTGETFRDRRGDGQARGYLICVWYC
ncbi:hypothetical protein MHIR_DE00216 [Candidatus Doolittlea endobia]|uniref:Uncharacterized protein n=1 Tax=Candidatus Doolittlea endobia TaxID=1778262 RepID=A0A143WUJ3_9ENTR|nr:hypothetical protein MHIR_DE00216 [Candidatus Doolittlea endobia]